MYASIPENEFTRLFGFTHLCYLTKIELLLFIESLDIHLLQ